MMRVEQFLRESAVRAPDKVALIAGATRLTFSAPDELSDRVAGFLVGRGIKRGDRVVIFMDNCWEAVVGIFAVLKAGAVFSPINPSTKADKLAFVINNCRAGALITQARLLAVATEAVAEAPSVRLAVVAGSDQEPAIAGGLRFEDAIAESIGGTAPERVGIDLDLAMLVYTSGSTGFPK